MKSFIEQNIIINVCTDIEEWAKEFYGMQDGEEIANIEEVTSECMGFAAIEGEKEIWVFIPKDCDENNLKETIAHEIGHITDSNFPTHPSVGDYEQNEAKADHYMNFFMLVDKIFTKVTTLIPTP